MKLTAEFLLSNRRNIDLKMRPAPRASNFNNIAAMAARNGSSRRQPQSSAALRQANEGLKNALTVRFRNAGPIVQNIDTHSFRC